KGWCSTTDSRRFCHAPWQSDQAVFAWPSGSFWNGTGHPSGELRHGRAAGAEVVVTLDRVTVVPQVDALLALGAARGVVLGRVLQLGEVVLVGRRPDEHLQLVVVLAALGTGLPVGAFVPLVEVHAAHGIAVVVPGAAVPGVREQPILVVVVADPV